MSARTAEAQPSDLSRKEARPGAVMEAILRTVAYADVFDQPLTAQQVHRYLVGVSASLPTVESALSSEQLVPRCLSYHRGFFTLAGREVIVERHLQKAELASRMWPKAVRYGWAIASLPFVRMVAITGSLAMDTVDPDADIDYLIVTAPHRLWLARSLCIAFVYLGRVERVNVCPNYVISLNALEQFNHSLFTAHELAQMRPLYGADVYRELLCANDWAYAFLPNAFDPRQAQARVRAPHSPERLKGWMESILESKLGDIWERRESQIKIRRLRQQAQGQAGRAAVFNAEQCKGHIKDHSSQIVQAYVQRLSRLGLDGEGIGS